jgi:excisionase family DNA binding protein
MNKSNLMTTAQLEAKYGFVRQQTIRNYIRDGKLPATKVGKAYFINESDFLGLFWPYNWTENNRGQK